MNKKERPLEVKRIADTIFITIGVGTLAWAATETFKDEAYVKNMEKDDGEKKIEPLKILNKKRFADDVVNQCLHEEEDGSTNISRFLDKMIDDTVGNGSEFIKYD